LRVFSRAFLGGYDLLLRDADRMHGRMLRLLNIVDEFTRAALVARNVLRPALVVTRARSSSSRLPL